LLLPIILTSSTFFTPGRPFIASLIASFIVSLEGLSFLVLRKTVMKNVPPRTSASGFGSPSLRHVLNKSSITSGSGPCGGVQIGGVRPYFFGSCFCFCSRSICLILLRGVGRFSGIVPPSCLIVFLTVTPTS